MKSSFLFTTNFKGVLLVYRFFFNSDDLISEFTIHADGYTLNELSPEELESAYGFTEGDMWVLAERGLNYIDNKEGRR